MPGLGVQKCNCGAPDEILFCLPTPKSSLENLNMQAFCLDGFVRSCGTGFQVQPGGRPTVTGIPTVVEWRESGHPGWLPACSLPGLPPGGSGRWTQSSHAAKGRAHSEARVSSCHSPTPKRPGPSRKWGYLWARPGVGLLPFITPSGLHHVTLTGRRQTPWRPWACALSTGTRCCQVQ